ncbi:MAG: LacI family DNA-binding transcriptional regulator [Acidobacteriaceae bacterium]
MADKKQGPESTRETQDATPLRAVGLKTLADYLGLCPATISVVLNNVPGRSIPPATRQRIKDAALKFNYQPSLLARSLRNQKTLTIGVLVPEIGDGYHSLVMGGVGDYLMNAGYFYFTAHHRHKIDLVEEYRRLFIGRGAEGIIAIDTALEHKSSVPTVAVAGHKAIPGVTNIVLDHRRAAELALRYIYQLGHRKIAFMRGQSFSSDSGIRWTNILEVAKEMGIVVRPELTVQLQQDLTSPELGYPAIQQLLHQRRQFTALLCFNDIAAIGAIRALRDADVRVPEDISVMGFDDVKSAAYHNPSLTTIRQPMHDMGETAARILLERIRGAQTATQEIAVEPELIVRESTQPPCSRQDK